MMNNRSDIAYPYPQNNNGEQRGGNNSNPFKTFWMGGYECCDMLNRYGNRVDLLTASGHPQGIKEDYENLAALNIGTVREGICWSKVEKQPYMYDWRHVDDMIIAGRNAGIQQVWDICHFGMPSDLSPLHPHFAARFVALCTAFVKHYRSMDTDSVLIITPINEVGFLSWLGGEVGATTPYTRGFGWEVKYRLAAAYIQGINAIKNADPSARILTTEPLVNIVAPTFADDIQKQAAATAHDEQFQVTDIISGRICPELCGSTAHLDIVGYNYYYSNQFSFEPGDTISWVNEHDDERYRHLHELLTEGYERYGRPVVLAETSHPGDDRPHWMNHVAEECSIILQRGIPLFGICWYPMIDRPDWDELHTWHRSGFWDKADLQGENDTSLLHDELRHAFLSAQKKMKALITQHEFSEAAF